MHYTKFRQFGDPLGTKMLSLEERFWAKVDKRRPDECWLWTAAQDGHGYGHFGINGGTDKAYRVSYKLNVGPIPEGLEIDHTCHNADLDCPGGNGCPHRACVNPAHLEAVLPKVNWARGESPCAKNARKTHCPQGHPYNAENTRITTNGFRICIACVTRKNRERYPEAWDPTFTWPIWTS